MSDKEPCFPDCSKVSLVVPVFKNVGESSIRNSPWQLANAKAFAKTYLHFIVFTWSIKMLRQLNS